MKEEDIREEQRRNGMSLGEEQQLYCDKEEYYSESTINEIMGRISDSVQEYIREYHKKPTMILISEQLEVFLKFHLNIIHYSQAIEVGHQIMEINFIMGTPTFTTPVLDGIEFEVR